MNRLDLPYVLVTALVGVGLFCAGYSVRPTPQKTACVEAPVFQAPVEPIPPPPPPTVAVTPVAPAAAPVTTVDQLPLYSGTPLAAPIGTIGDDLLPIRKPAPVVAVAPSGSVVHPVVAPVVTPVAAPKAPSPEPIVLEEIPDNPYKRAHR